MSEKDLLRQSIDAIWETLPPTWGRIRVQIHENAIKGHGISLIQFQILRHTRRGIDTAAALAEHLQVSRPAVSQAVEGLVQKGFLQRARSVQDRREVFLQPSPEGKALLDEAFALSQAWMAEQMRALDQEELSTVTSAMLVLRRAFQIQPRDAGRNE